MFKKFPQNRMPKTSFFLFGPRQVGKSTILKTENPDLIIDLLDPELQLTYNKNPNLLQQQLSDISSETSKTILIDEIQRVPKLLDIVHSAMEKRPELQFILCPDSSSCPPISRIISIR